MSHLMPRVKEAVIGGVRSALARAGYRLLREDDVAMRECALAAIGRLVSAGVSSPGQCVRTIAFSKDRPLQLHAMLGSYFECFDDAPPIVVIYTASSDRMLCAYQQARMSYEGKPLTFVRERDFRSDLFDQLAAIGQGRVLFLVDDIIFIDRLRISDLIEYTADTHVLSLRLAPRITFSYTLQRPEMPPALREASQGAFLEWKWADGELDWAYAFSVDGHVYRAAEILELARALPFRAPNSFESRMQIYASYFGERNALCYSEPKLLNVPCNRVQGEFANLHGKLHQDELLRRWEEGDRIDFQRLMGYRCNACHELLDLPLTRSDGHESRAPKCDQ